MIVKVCGIREVENLKQLVKLPINWIGFIFYKPSDRFLEAPGLDSEAMRIFEISDFGMKKVGVFVNANREEIETKVNEYKLDIIQLHGDESPEFCQKLKALSFTIVKAFSLDENFDFNRLNPYKDHCDYFLFDTKGQLRGGNGQTFNWGIVNQYKLDVPFILSGGIGPDEITALRQFQHPQFAGVDLNSKFELRPGYKNAALLNSFVSSFRNYILSAQQ